MPIDGNYERQSNGGLRGCHAQRKKDKYHTDARLGIWVVSPERDKIQVGGIQHQFDTYEHDNGIAACQRSGKADREQ
jgi:hypothetical protein